MKEKKSGEICMTANDYCKIIECAAKSGAYSLNIDKFSIKFQNGGRVESISEKIQPVLVDYDKPNPTNIHETDDDEGNDAIMKAEELSIMAISDPAKFEELLANEDSLLEEFSREVDGIEGNYEY